MIISRHIWEFNTYRQGKQNTEYLQKNLDVLAQEKLTSIGNILKKVLSKGKVLKNTESLETHVEAVEKLSKNFQDLF